MTTKIDGILDKWKLYNSNLRNLAYNSVKSYALDLKGFCKFIFKDDNVYPSDFAKIQLKEIREWIVFLKSQSIGSSTMSRKVSSLKNFFSWLEVEYGEKNAAIDRIELPKIDKKLPRPNTTQEIEKLIRSFENSGDKEWIVLRNKAILILLYTSGLRISEALNLKKSILPLSDSLVIHGKGNKERMIPILNVANQAVTMYRQYCPFTKNHGEYIFLGVRGNKLNPRSFQKIIEKARRANGLLNTTTPHSFRHSFATHLLNEDMDLRSIQKLLGHSSLSSTEVYTKVEQKKLIQVYKLTHPRERL